MELQELDELILGEIFNRLPTMEAVRTCIVCKDWKNFWKLVNQLLIDETTFPPELYLDETIVNCLLKMVFMHPGPVFRLELRNSIVSRQSITDMLVFLNSQGLRELVLSPGAYWFIAPAYIYELKNLVKLELCSCEVGNPPESFRGFPSLKVLKLDLVGMSSYAMGKIFQSPVLEYVSLEQLYDVAMHIHCENLREVAIEGLVQEVSIPYAPKMESFSAAFSPLVLNFSDYGVFRNLRTVRLQVRLTDTFDLESMIHFLNKSPNLEILQLTEDSSELAITPGPEFWGKWTVKCRFVHLRKVRLHLFRRPEALDLIAFFHNTSPNLKSLIVSFLDNWA